MDGCLGNKCVRRNVAVFRHDLKRNFVEEVTPSIPLAPASPIEESFLNGSFFTDSVIRYSLAEHSREVQTIYLSGTFSTECAMRYHMLLPVIAGCVI